MIFTSIGQLSQHLMFEHIQASNTCNWKMCAYWNMDSDYSKLESHVISHIYLVWIFFLLFFFCLPT